MQIIDNIINEVLNSDKNLFTKDDITLLLKRATKNFTQPIVESNGVVANPVNTSITYNGVDKVLPRKEFLLLYYLMNNKNKIVRREILLRDIWGNDVIVTDRTIDVHIRRLRLLVGKEFIQTRKCYGYGWFEK